MKTDSVSKTRENPLHENEEITKKKKVKRQPKDKNAKHRTANDRSEKTDLKSIFICGEEDEGMRNKEDAAECRFYGEDGSTGQLRI